MTGRRLLVATRSAHKLRELRELLALEHAELVSLDDLGIEDDPVEDGETFETNAAIKARAGPAGQRPADAGRRFRASRSTRWAAAPGSGRGATPARTRRTRPTTRSCSRPCAGCRPSGAAPATCACWPLALPGVAGPRGGVPVITTRGTCRGRIATEPRGTGGFGYDPIFEPASEPPGGRTLGLWTPAEKHAISHRARAARRMAPRLAALGF